MKIIGGVAMKIIGQGTVGSDIHIPGNQQEVTLYDDLVSDFST